MSYPTCSGSIGSSSMSVTPGAAGSGGACVAAWATQSMNANAAIHLCPRQYPAGLRYRTQCDMARLPLQVLGAQHGRQGTGQQHLLQTSALQDTNTTVMRTTLPVVTRSPARFSFSLSVRPAITISRSLLAYRLPIYKNCVKTAP